MMGAWCTSCHSWPSQFVPVCCRLLGSLSPPLSPVLWHGIPAGQYLASVSTQCTPHLQWQDMHYAAYSTPCSHTCWAVSGLRRCVVGSIQVLRHPRVLELQMRGLVVLVVGGCKCECMCNHVEAVVQQKDESTRMRCNITRNETETRQRNAT
jgi:hypothetical protein